MSKNLSVANHFLYCLATRGPLTGTVAWHPHLKVMCAFIEWTEPLRPDRNRSQLLRA
jgi:hypothetical protein